MPNSNCSEITADVFNLLNPDANTTGNWMCAGMRADGSGTYSQTIRWDGQTLLAAIENTNKNNDYLKLYIQGAKGQEPTASLNGEAIELEDALVRFCEESANMPRPIKLDMKRDPGVRR